MNRQRQNVELSLCTVKWSGIALPKIQAVFMKGIDLLCLCYQSEIEREEDIENPDLEKRWYKFKTMSFYLLIMSCEYSIRIYRHQIEKTLYPLGLGISMVNRLGKGRPAIITKNEKEVYQVVIFFFWQRRSNHHELFFSLKSQFRPEKRNYPEYKEHSVLSIGVRSVTKRNRILYFYDFWVCVPLSF